MIIELKRQTGTEEVCISINEGNHMPRWIRERGFCNYEDVYVNIDFKQIGRFIQAFKEEGNKYNEMGSPQGFESGITIKNPEHLEQCFEKIQSLLAEKGDGSTKITSIEFDLVSKINPTIAFRQEISQIKNQQLSPKDKFLAEHARLFNESKSSLFGSFRKTSINDNMDLTQILEHAKVNNNRSRQACVNLGWLNSDGTLNDNSSLPEEVRMAYDPSSNKLKS